MALFWCFFVGSDLVLDTFLNMDEQKYKIKNSSKKCTLQKYIQNRRFESDFVFVENLITEHNKLVSSTKALYYENLAKKLNNPLLQEKTH